MKDLKKILISEDNTILETLNIINKNLTGTAIVVNEKRQLLGTITDGDIRRALIKKISLNTNIKDIYNKNCKYVYENYNIKELEKFFKNYMKVIPVVTEKEIIIDYIELKDIFNEHSNKENYVLIMAGGLGTRLRPLTYDIPKPMLKVGDKPILQTIIEQFRSYGFKNILISVNYKSDIIESYFKDGFDFGVSIKYIKEKNRMGTAGSIKLTKSYLQKPFFVINGDILTNVNFERFLEYHLHNNYDMTIGTRNYEMQVPYGVLNINENCITSLEEKPIYNFMVSGGIYVLNPDVIQYIPENQYYDITQLINTLLLKKYKVAGFPIQEYWMDIGRIEDYHNANEDIKKYF